MFTGSELLSHIFSTDLPGVRKKEIKVEVEDSKYLVIRIQAIDGSNRNPAKSFTRKFRFSGLIDIDRISASYEDGVLAIIAPRSFTTKGFFIDSAEVPERLEVVARAA